ncbi:hypothetical protein [Singulisphaera sp. PoT]|uniref:hypothetical protein n=1 Tax=Singulisphaera sp. PoT TaxID=3411797 RepID=UPI003BF55728
MGWSVNEHSQPDRKLDYYDRKLGRLRGVVKRKENSHHISKAAENLRLAALAVIKAKQALIREYPQRDPTGHKSKDLLDEKERWLTLSTDAIIEEYGPGDD